MCLIYLYKCFDFSPEISQGETEGPNEQRNKQNEENDAYLAQELASQQDEEPMEQEDDLPMADDDNMADQADEPDSGKNEGNALEQQDHDDADTQGKTCLLHEITIYNLYRSMSLC